MKRRDFEQHLRKHGCYLRREGKGHTVFTNPSNEKSASVPRHTEIKTPTLRRICRDLEIPVPLTR
ncbi:MAG TPA: type II toxin-antitoxin system HicA family toxin [Thermoanaerobaculia bacterium]